MSAKNLDAGQSIALTDTHPNITDVIVGFGWNVVTSNSPDPELVPMVLLLDDDGKVIDPDAVAFFNQLSAAGGAVRYVIGDDQEQVDIHLPGVPDTAANIVFLLFVNPDPRRPGTFRAVRNAYVQLADGDGGSIARASIPTGTADVNAVVAAELYRYNGAWKFRALGDGYTGGIQAVANDFGFTL